MKKITLILGVLMFVSGMLSTAPAALIDAVSASGTGTYNNSPDLLIDHNIPGEGTWWTADTNVWWYGTDPVFTIDLGSTYKVEDVVVSVDNNDDYEVQYSLNSTNWITLFAIDASYGDIPEAPGGMDTMSTSAVDSEYVSQIDFTPVQARYLRIYATAGDNSYAVAEVEAYGQPVPIPGAVWLLGSGLFGLVVARRKKRSI